MTKKTIEEQIREYYQSSDTNEWLVEKNKVKEARFLKEAVARIDSLRKTSEHYLGLYEQAVATRDEVIKQKWRELNAREDKIAGRERALEIKIRDVTHSLRVIEKLGETN